MIFKIKKGKSEIIQSLKVLLKKKEQMKNENEDNANDKNNGDEVIDNKNKEKDLRKKIYVNKIKNKELKKIIIN